MWYSLRLNQARVAACAVLFTVATPKDAVMSKATTESIANICNHNKQKKATEVPLFVTSLSSVP